MKTKNEVEVYKKEIVPVVAEARDIEIKNPADMKKAVEILSKMNQVVDKVVEEKERITKPLNQALRAERSRWKPLEIMYEDAIEMLRGKMSKYQTQKEFERRQEEAKIAARIGEGKGKLKIETAVKKIEAVVIPDKEIATDVGLVQFRETATLKLTDVNLIPDEYFVLDEKKLLTALKEGVVVPGAEIAIIQVPVNYR